MLIYSETSYSQSFIAVNTLNKFQWTSNQKPTFWGSQTFWGADSVTSVMTFLIKILLKLLTIGFVRSIQFEILSSIISMQIIQ